MKAFFTLEVRKSVSELAFIFGKSDFLGLIDFDFLNLAKFITVDKFLLFLLISSPSVLLAAPGVSWFPA